MTKGIAVYSGSVPVHKILENGLVDFSGSVGITGSLTASNITLNTIGGVDEPTIKFFGSGSTTSIDLRVISGNTLSWEGSEGQLFSITDNLTSGTIFAVGDVSGMPLLEADADGTVSMARFGTKVGVGTNSPTSTLTVSGTFTVTGSSLLGNISGSTAQFASITGSFSGNGSQITNLTSSNISNFTNDVRAQFSAGTNIGITNGVISVTGSVPASVSAGGVDYSVQFNSGSVLSGSSNLIYNYNTNTLSGTIAQFTGISSSYLVLSSTIEPTQTEGTIFYDNTNGLMRQWTEVAGVDLHLGQQLAVRVKNDSGATLAKGKIVHITGSTNSDTPLVTTASYESDSVSADTLGVLMSQLGPNDIGYALLYGVLTGINLSTYASGDMLYLSSSGDFTDIVPQSPLHEVRIGQVTRATSNGAMFVRIQNGYEIDELHDVLISGKQNGDLLSWDSNALVWKNTKTLSGSYKITQDLTASNISLVANSVTAEPTISFLGSSSSTPIDLKVKSDSSLSFEGTAGTLLYVSDNLTSGTIFSVNDAASLPIVEVDANGTVSIAEFAGNVGIGTSSPQYKLDINGTLRATGNSYFQAVSGTTATFSNYVSGTTGRFTTVSASVVTASTGLVSVLTASDIYSSNTIRADGAIQADGGSLTTNDATFQLLNTTATNISFGGASTSMSIGSSTGQTTIKNNLYVSGTLSVIDDLTVGTDSLFVDTSTDRLGIGLGGALPSSSIHIRNNNARIILDTVSSPTGYNLELASNYNAGNRWWIGSDNGGTKYIGHSGVVSTFASSHLFLSSYYGMSFNVGNSPTEANTRMVITQNGNVGIGTTIPQHKLSVTGTLGVSGVATFSTITASNVQITNLDVDTITAREYYTELVSSSIIYESGSTKFGDTSDDIHDFTGSVNIVSGNLMLGAPGENIDRTLTIHGSNTFNKLFYITQTIGGPVLGFGTGNQSISFGTSVQQWQYMNHYASTAHQLFIGTTQALHINSSRNVGIGTTSPASALHVVSTNSNNIGATISEFRNASNAERIRIIDENATGTKPPGLKAPTSGYGLGLYASAGPIIFYTEAGETEKLRITSAGDVGIGTASPEDKLHIVGGTLISGSSTASFRVSRTSAGVSTSEHSFVASNNSPTYLYGQNLIWNGEKTGNTVSAEKPYYETFVPAAGIREFGFINKTSAGASFISTDLTASLVLKNNGNVGIGTTSPGALLDLSIASTSTPALRLRNGNTSVSFDRPQIAFSYNVTGQYNHFINTRHNSANSNNAIDFYVSDGTSANTLTSGSIHNLTLNSGKVGIGTTSPVELLDVSTSTATAGQGARIGEAKIGTWEGGTDYAAFTHNTIHGTSLSYALLQSSAGETFLNTATGKALWFRQANSTNMVITSAGAVGIGTTSPSRKLHVNGTFLAQTELGTDLSPNGAIYMRHLNANSANDSVELHIRPNNGKSGYITFTENGVADRWGIGTSGSSGDLKFFVGSPLTGTERLTIKSGGNVGIGTTSPQETLSVSGSIGVSGSITPNGDGVHEIGSASNRFADVYAVQTTVGAVFETGLTTIGIEEYPTGTVLVWKQGKLKPCDKEEDVMVMGIGKHGKQQPIILGAEPVLVTGKVEEGDWIVTSRKVGHGKALKKRWWKRNLTGKIIAQALESCEGESNLIKCMINKT